MNQTVLAAMDDKTSTAATKARPEYVSPGSSIQRTIFMAMLIGRVVHWVVRAWWVEGLEHRTQVPQVNRVALQVDQQKARGGGRDKREGREGREADSSCYLGC